MSGGWFNCIDQELKSVIFGFTDEPSNKFEDIEFSELVWDVLNLIHEYDWYACGDTNKEHFLKLKRDFKNKWFDTPKEERVKKIINSILEKSKRELFETFGIEEDNNKQDTYIEG